MEQICRVMPKVELHAHLNGCISDETLSELLVANQSNGVGDTSELKLNSIRTLSNCFDIFKQIHNVIRTPEILRRVTCSVIESFANENVIYLELRTTPKKVHEISSKREYLESVIDAIVECKRRMISILVKLLISIDREKGAFEGDENVTLGIELAKNYPDVVVGIDVSGNPITGNIDWILPLLIRARDNGLRIACHLPEVINLEETDQVLEFSGMGRLGHGVFLHPSFGGTTAQWESVKTKRIPVEACITSNIVSGVSKSLEQHYVRLLHENGIPFVICTDDSGVFQTTLSEEYIKFLQIVPMPLSELKELCLDSVSYSFASENEKCVLCEIISNWWADPKNFIK